MNKEGRKSSDMEKEERILFLLSLRSKGVKATSDLFRFFSEKHPNLTKRQFEYDLAEAKAQIAEYFEKDVEFEIAEIAKHLWELYSKSFKLQDFRECRTILKELRELKSLTPKKILLGNDPDNPIDFSGLSTDEKKQLLTLFSKAGIDEDK